jgi:hypothetical protein
MQTATTLPAGHYWLNRHARGWGVVEVLASKVYFERGHRWAAGQAVECVRATNPKMVYVFDAEYGIQYPAMLADLKRSRPENRKG